MSCDRRFVAGRPAAGDCTASGIHPRSHLLNHGDECGDRRPASDEVQEEAKAASPCPAPHGIWLRVLRHHAFKRERLGDEIERRPDPHGGVACERDQERCPHSRRRPEGNQGRRQRQLEHDMSRYPEPFAGQPAPVRLDDIDPVGPNRIHDENFKKTPAKRQERQRCWSGSNYRSEIQFRASLFVEPLTTATCGDGHEFAAIRSILDGKRRPELAGRYRPLIRIRPSPRRAHEALLWCGPLLRTSRGCWRHDCARYPRTNATLMRSRGC